MTTIPGSEVRPLSFEEFMAEVEADATPETETAARHKGPGPHANGSPQSIHGKGDSGGPLSIAKQGGDSVQVSGRRPSSGFMVARPPSFGTIVTADDWFANGRDILIDFVDQRAAQFKTDPDAFVGVWWDKKHREFALDVSMNVADLDDALSKGRAWDQQAIWDVVNMVEIPTTGGTGGRSGQVGRSSPTGLGRDDSRGEGSLGRPDRGDDEGGIRGRGRVTDPEVLEALDRWRHLAGQHNQKSHGHGGGGISAGMQAGSKTRVRNPADGPDGAEWRNLDRETREKMKADLQGAYGVTQEKMTRNIIEAYDTATPGEHRFGEEWYGSAHNTAEEMSKSYGMSVEQSTGVLAALSPRTAWESNVVWGDHVAKLVAEDPEIADLDFPVTKTPMGAKAPMTMSARDWMARDGLEVSAGKRFSEYTEDQQVGIARYTGQRDGAKIRAVRLTREGFAEQEIGVAPPFDSSMRNALRIARGSGTAQDISTELNGHKVRSFYNDILTGGQSSSITIDAHALDAAIIGAKATRSGRKVADVIPGAPDPGKWINERFTNVKAGTAGPYAVFHESFRQATVRINNRRAKTGLPPLTGPQVQAIAWITTLERKGT